MSSAIERRGSAVHMGERVLFHLLDPSDEEARAVDKLIAVALIPLEYDAVRCELYFAPWKIEERNQKWLMMCGGSELGYPKRCPELERRHAETQRTDPSKRFDASRSFHWLHNAQRGQWIVAMWWNEGSRFDPCWTAPCGLDDGRLPPGEDVRPDEMFKLGWRWYGPAVWAPVAHPFPDPLPRNPMPRNTK
jgi:hypothetical protein